MPSTRDFQFIGGSLALDFINTVGNRLGVSRDYFASQAELERWSRLAGLLGKREQLHLSAAQWGDVLRTREELYGLFKPAADGKPLKNLAIERLNAKLAQVAPHRQLVAQKTSVQWAWKTSPGDPVQLLAPILFGAAELLTNGSFRKVRECGGETCGWLFLDRSQAGKRKWCSMTDCGNRDKVRRYYRRRAAL